MCIFVFSYHAHDFITLKLCFARTFGSVCANYRYKIPSNDYFRNSETKTILIAKNFCGSCFAFFNMLVP